MTDSALRIRTLREEQKPTREICETVRLSDRRVSNLERVLKRSQPAWLEWVALGKLSYKHLEAVLCLPVATAEELLRRTMAGGWAAHRLRAEVKVAKGERRPDDPHPNADVAHLESQLTELVGSPVSINTKGKGGELLIRYTDNDVLEGLLERLGYRFEY